MKNFKLVMLFVLGLNLVITSCSSDDDNNNPGTTAGMIIDGTTYNIGSGFLEPYGANGNGSFDWDVTLFSDGFTVDAGQQTITGVGAILYLDLNTNSETGLVPGTYVFAQNRDEFTWVYAEGITDFDAETEEGNYFEAVSGTIIITGTGSNQTIVATLEDENGNAMTASYTGVLESI